MKTTNFKLLVISFFVSIWYRLLDRRIMECTFTKIVNGYELRFYSLSGTLLRKSTIKE